MDNNRYFFQGDSILVPNGADLGGVPCLDRFTIPGIGGDGDISCVVVPPEAPLPPSCQAIPVRQALAGLPGYLPEGSGPAAQLFRAFHIAQWRQESLFCGSCGAKNVDCSRAWREPSETNSSPKQVPKGLDSTTSDSTTGEMVRLCPRCGRMEFPRISPAIIIRITNNEGEILLAHNKKFAPGVYSLIAGFVEPGETLEATAIRETREEAGIEIRDVQYLCSQPWPFPNSLTVGFSARHASGTVKPDGIEIEDARWFSRENLPSLPGKGSMSRYLIENWIGIMG